MDKRNNGIIVDSLIKLFDFFKTKIKTSYILSFFYDFDSFEKAYEKSSVSKAINKASKVKYKLLDFKLACAKNSQNSIFVNILEKLSESFFKTSLSSFGMFFLTYGAFLLSVNFATHTDRIFSLDFSDTFIFGLILTFVSFLLLPNSKTNISSVINQSTILSHVFTNIFAIKHTKDTKDNETKHNTGTSIMLGLLCGIISYIVSPLLVIFLFITIFALYLIITSPENGVILICLLFPFINQKLLSFILGVTTVSFIFKFIRGKRSIKFDISSASLVIMTICLSSAFIGAFDYVSAKSDLFNILISCLAGIEVILIINSSKLVKRCFDALSISLVFAVLHGLVGFISTYFMHKDIANIFVEIYKFGMTSVFIHSDFFAAFLICIIPLFFVSKRHIGNFGLFTLILIFVFCLIMTNSVYAIVSLILAVAISMLLFSKHGLITVSVSAISLLVVKILTPNVAVYTVEKYLTDITSYSVQTNLTGVASSTEFLSNFWLTGAGLGGDSVAIASSVIDTNMTYYSGFGETYINLFLKIGIPLSVIIFALFTLCISKILTYSLGKYSSPEAKKYCYSVFCSVMSLILYAFFTNLFIDAKIIMMIILVTALGCSVCNSAKRDYISKNTPRDDLYL